MKTSILLLLLLTALVLLPGCVNGPSSVERGTSSVTEDGPDAPSIHSVEHGWNYGGVDR